MTCSEQLAAWASGLRFEAIPRRVVSFARSQLLSTLAAARAGRAHPLGEAIERAYGPPVQADPARAACSLAALTMCLDFDDSVFAGHVSHSTVTVPVAHAAALELDGPDLVTAIVAANECAARVTAAATIGPFRGQTAAHSHLAGAAAARLRAERAPADRWVSALGLAFAAPPWSLLPAFLGSDAKVLIAAVPVRTALDACDAAAAGLRGAPDVLEHEDGFLTRFAEVPLPDALVAGLGQRWHTETLSFKVYPASTGAYAGVDCAVDLHRELDGIDPERIEEVVVSGSLFTVGTEAEAARYAAGEDPPVSALTYSSAYTVATALLTGGLRPEDLAPPATDDPVRRALGAKVRVEHDAERSRRAILATVPMGEGLRQAGQRAAGWVERSGGTALFDGADASDLMNVIGPPSETFENAEKAMGARVTVRLDDGTELTRERDIPTGMAGPETRARHLELTRDKFLACGGSEAAADALEAIDAAPAGEVARVLAEALA